MKSVLVVATALFLSGVAHGGIPRNVKHGLNHGEYIQSPNRHTQAIQRNTQSSYLESPAPSQDTNQPLPAPGIPPKFLSFSTPEERAISAAAQQPRTTPFLDEDRNSVIQDSALAPQPSPPQLEIQNIQQGAGPAIQTGVTETVVSTGTAPAEGTVIGAPYLIAIHHNIIRRYGIPVAKPYPVPVSKEVRVPIERPVPYKVDKPYAVQVNVPQPYAVDRPYPVPVDAPYPVRVPQPVGVPVPRPVPVHVPYPVGVPVPQPVAVHVSRAVGVPVPQHVAVPVRVPYPVPVAPPAVLAAPQTASIDVAKPLAITQPAPAQIALPPPAPVSVAQPAPFNFPHPAPLGLPQGPPAFSHIR